MSHKAQWFKNGDHPLDYEKPIKGMKYGSPKDFTPEEQKQNDWEGQVVRRYRNQFVDGRVMCKDCGYILHNHGWIDQGLDGVTVCPGMWVWKDDLNGKWRSDTVEPTEEVIDWEAKYKELEASIIKAKDFDGKDVNIKVADVLQVDSLIAGALYDFGAFLTTMKKPVTFGASELSSPMADLLKAFCEARKFEFDGVDLNWGDKL